MCRPGLHHQVRLSVICYEGGGNQVLERRIVGHLSYNLDGLSLDGLPGPMMTMMTDENTGQPTNIVNYFYPSAGSPSYVGGQLADSFLRARSRSLFPFLVLSLYHAHAHAHQVSF